MSDSKETFHLMAVPKRFTGEVIKAGGRFLKLKNKQWEGQKKFKLIQQKGFADELIHYLDPSQHRSYEMMGTEFIEDMSICKTVFQLNRGDGYQTFNGIASEVTCPDCHKALKKIRKK